VLTRLLKALPAGDAVLSEDAVREEARTLIFGGKETAGASLTWSAYALAAHGEIQAKAADEVDRVLGDAPVTAAAIGRLKYIEQVYKEAIRIYPPVAFMSREAAQDAEVGGYFVPRRSFVFISPYVMHHNPEWFAEPDVFRPERFQPASEKAIPQLAYVPFGAGAHNCVGKRLAMLEGPTALATLLQHCRLELPDPPPKVELVADMTLHPKGGLRLRLAPRKKALAVVE
jgi:cytochrome P450